MKTHDFTATLNKTHCDNKPNFILLHIHLCVRHKKQNDRKTVSSGRHIFTFLGQQTLLLISKSWL